MVSCQLVELGSRYIHVHMERSVFVNGDERQIYIGSLSAGKLLLCLFSCFLQSLESHLVSLQIYAVFLCKAVCHEVQQHFVEVVSAQLVVSVCCQNLEYAVTQFQNGNVEGSSTQVIYQDLVLIFILIQSVSQRCSRRLVDYSLNVQSGDFPASLVACFWLSVKYAGTVITASDTFSPR